VSTSVTPPFVRGYAVTSRDIEPLSALQKKRVIFFDSNKCNFLKHSKLVKFSQITLLNVNAQNEKIIFCLKIFKFNLKLWILKKEKN
jgi:hypothetical protein